MPSQTRRSRPTGREYVAILYDNANTFASIIVAAVAGYTFNFTLITMSGSWEDTGAIVFAFSYDRSTAERSPGGPAGHRRPPGGPAERRGGLPTAWRACRSSSAAWRACRALWRPFRARGYEEARAGREGQRAGKGGQKERRGRRAKEGLRSSSSAPADRDRTTPRDRLHHHPRGSPTIAAGGLSALAGAKTSGKEGRAKGGQRRARRGRGVIEIDDVAG